MKKGGIMDFLIAEINKNMPDGQKVERLNHKPYQICENGSHKSVETGKFIKQG